MDFFLALFCFSSFCMNGVNDGEKNMKVVSNTRDVITLHTETESDHILWMVGAQNIHSPEGYEWIISKYDSYRGVRNIKNPTRLHTVWSFSDSRCVVQKQNPFSRSACNRGTKADEIIQVMKGDAVTLHTDVAELQENQVIEWLYVSKDRMIAQVTKQKLTVDEKFEGRLNFDQTGSLTIKNITTTDSGDYQRTFYRENNAEFKCFNVKVYDSLPSPVIMRDYAQNTASSSKCVLLCLAINVPHASLSWYKGSSLLSSISVSDFNIKPSLSLEVDYEDTNTYTCVLNNTIINNTQHANINKLCQQHSSSTAGYSLHIYAIVPALAAVVVVCVIIKCCRRSRHAGQNVQRSDRKEVLKSI